MKFKFLIDNYKISIFFLLIFTGCIEDQSLVMSPQNGESYQFKTFKLNNLNSYSFSESDFSPGNSSRLYLGDLTISDDGNGNLQTQKLYSYINIDKQILNDNQFCSEEDLISFNSIDLIIPVTSFQDLDELDDYVSPGSENSQQYNNQSISTQNNEGSSSHYIKAYILNENDINILDEDFESSLFQQSVDVISLQDNDVVPVLIDRLTNTLRINLNQYVYANYENSISNNEISCELLSRSDCLCYDFVDCYKDSENNKVCESDVDWNQNNEDSLGEWDSSDNCSNENDDCYWIHDPQSTDLNVGSCENISTFSNTVCNELDDLNVIIEYNNPYSENNQIIELYSSDNDQIALSPYISVNYFTEGTSTESTHKCSFESISSDELNSDEYLSNFNDSYNGNGMILGFDQSITTLYNNLDNISCTCPDDCGDDGLCPGDVGYPQNCDNHTNSDDCISNECYWINNNCQADDHHENDGICNDNDYWDSTCTFGDIDPFVIESNTIIPEDWMGELFQIDLELNQEYMDSFENIAFYFSDIFFIYKDLDPSSDNDTTEGNSNWDFEDCGTDNDCDIIDTNGTQENFIVDIGEPHELFDDYGIDNCPDIYETGLGCGDEDNNLYNSIGTENNFIWDHSGDEAGYDGICQVDECEHFDDYGYDKVQDDKESGCFDDDNEYGKILENNLTFSEILDESGLDISDLNSYTMENEGTICGEIHWAEEECDTCTSDDPNGDNFNADPSDDNWVDCNDDLSICENDENWDSETMGNGEWNSGEKFEKNEQWDWVDCDIIDSEKVCENDDSWDSNTMGNQVFDICNNYLDNEENCDKYEFFNDIGIDGIPDAYENYNDETYDDNYPDNPSGTEGNKFRDDNEPFFDYGLDQIITSLEPGHNEGEENNKKYDKDGNFEEDYDDYGLDQCQNIHEGSGGECNESNVSNLEDPHDDNYNIDPNLDNYDKDDNDSGTENNNRLDWNDCNDDQNICEDDDQNWDSETMGNSLWDESEGEKWYDYGYDQLIDVEEDNYYANIANYIVSSGNSYKIDIDQESITFDQPALSSNKQVGLWISSIEKIDDGYRIFINVHTLIDLVAFQFKVNHFYHQYEVDSIDNKSLYLFEDYYVKDNTYNPYDSTFSEEKYIFDATVYDDNFICDNSIKYYCTDYNNSNEFDDYNSCQESECLGLCVKACPDNLSLMYGYGIKTSFDFVETDNENYSLYNFFQEHSHSNINYKHTNLVVYFENLEDNLLFDQEESIQLNIGYFDEENNEFINFNNIGTNTVSVDQDSIKISVSPIIQDYINNTIDYNNLIISVNDKSYNFSKLPIIYNENDSKNNPRLEIFYSE